MKFLISCLAIVSCALAGKLNHLVHQAGAYSQQQHQVGHGATVQHEYIHQPAAYVSHQHHVSHEGDASIVKSVSDVSPDGSYGYEYETENGISAKEHGVGGKGAQGSFSYTAPDGQIIHLSYVADENGFHPIGSHIPQPPPTPAHVLRSLEYIAAHSHQEQKYAHERPGSAHISAHNNAGHSQAYDVGLAQVFNAGQARAYSGRHAHHSYAYGKALTHQTTPYHHYK